MRDHPTPMYDEVGPPSPEQARRDRIDAAQRKGCGLPSRRAYARPKAVDVPHERLEQVALAQYLDHVVGEHGWCHIPNEGRRSPRQGHSLRAQGLKRGVPDVLIFVPPPLCPTARGVAIELKRQGATESAVSEDQREWHASLYANGWRVRVCCGADEAIAWLKGMGY